jgi:REP element-mobilizing transposase RayT
MIGHTLIVFMRPLRLLKQGVWYEIHTHINNREPLFRRYTAWAIFAAVFRETKRRFTFEIRGLCLVDDRLAFYIKPEDGLELPDIMKWLKQVFAQRYNRKEGRIGHIWGDRYKSLIIEEEAAMEGTGGEASNTGESFLQMDIGVRPQYEEPVMQTVFFVIFPFPATPTPG